MLSSDKPVFGLRHADIFWSKSHSWKAVTLVHYFYLFGAFAPYKSIFTDVPRKGEAKSYVPKRSGEETSLDPCCLSDFIYCREFNSLSMLDLTSVSGVCSRHKSHGGKMEDYIL